MALVKKYDNKTPKDSIDFSFPSIEPIEFAKELAETMIAEKGLSISAPALGKNLRVIALNGEVIYVCYNPRVVHKSEDQSYMNESDIVNKGLVVKIKRPNSIRLRFETPNGETRTMKFEGLSAHLIQHEMDIIDNNNYLNNATKYHKDKALKDQKIYNKIMEKVKK